MLYTVVDLRVFEGCRLLTCLQLWDICLSRKLPCKFSALHTYSTSVTTAAVPKTRYWLYSNQSLYSFICYFSASKALIFCLSGYNHTHGLSLTQVRALQGIPALVELFSSDNRSVQHYATGATRNLIYENAENKVTLVDAGGVVRLVSILSEPDEELRKTITGNDSFLSGSNPIILLVLNKWPDWRRVNKMPWLQASCGICPLETTWRKSCQKKLYLSWREKSWFRCVTASHWAHLRETSSTTPLAASGDPTDNMLLLVPCGPLLVQMQTYTFL